MPKSKPFAIECPYDDPYEFVFASEDENKERPTPEELQEMVDTVYALAGEVLSRYSVEELEHFPVLGGKHTIDVTSYVHRFDFHNGTDEENLEVYFHIENYYRRPIYNYPRVTSDIERSAPSRYEYFPHKIAHRVCKDTKDGNVSQAYHIELGTYIDDNKSRVTVYLDDKGRRDRIVISGRNLGVSLVEIDEAFPEFGIKSLLEDKVKKGSRIGASIDYSQTIEISEDLREGVSVLIEKLQHFIATGEMLP